MKKDWRNDRIISLKTTLSDLIQKVNDNAITKDDLTNAVKVLNTNPQLEAAAAKAAKFESL